VSAGPNMPVALFSVTIMTTEKYRPTILIIEDEPLTLRVLKSVFENAKFNVLTANDGHQAVVIYEQRKAEIDLVLSDIALPRMDGWTVNSHLKAIDPAAKVIFTSGYFDPQLEAQCEKEGIDYVIPKPFNLDEVVSIVRSRIRSRVNC
jgi:CheY-like chemotaxis protein